MTVRTVLIVGALTHSKKPHVRFWHKADILDALSDVRFWVNSGHRRAAIRCLLLTQSGHEPLGIAAVETDP